MTPPEFLTIVGYGLSLFEKHDPNTYIGCIILNLKCLREVGKD